MAVITLQPGQVPAPVVTPGPDDVLIDGAVTPPTVATRGLCRVSGRPRVEMHSVKATGPGFAYFQQVGEIDVFDANTTGVAWVLDDVETGRLNLFTVGGVGTAAKPAAAINGRGKPWRRVEIDDGQIGVTGEIFGPGINFVTVWAPPADA